MSQPIMIPGPVFVDGQTAADRRATLLSMGDDDLAAWACEGVERMRSARSHLETIARFVDVPVGEVAASPFGLRATALGASEGVACVHHELRAPLHWDAGLVPDEVRDPMHGIWDRGVLHVGKYQGFHQDDPFATFNPNHMAKWTPHEITHRVCKFFWREGMTRWELYLGARLNELLPVVLWYGPDQVVRLKDDGFDRSAQAADRPARLADAVWWSESESDLHAHVRHTVQWLRSGLEAFERELGAIAEERASGRCVVVPHPVLNSSSDATAYVVGHYARLTSRPVTLLMRQGLRPGKDYLTTIDGYRSHIESVFDRMLFGTIEIDISQAERLRGARWVRDVVGRGSHASRRCARSARRHLEELRGVLDAAEQDDESIDIESWERRFDDDEWSVARATGLRALSGVEDGVVANLRHGVASVSPNLAEHLDDSRIVDAMISSETMCARRDLTYRVLDILAGIEISDELRGQIELDFAIANSRRRDDQVERLSVLPDDGVDLPADAPARR